MIPPTSSVEHGTIGSGDPALFTSRPLFLVIIQAFFAIFRRDLVVARRSFISTLGQALIIPGFFLFIFGRVLPLTGAAVAGYGALLLPGMVAMALLMTALMNVTIPLVLDIGNEREIEDRLLAPLPNAWIAIEKVLFAALNSLIAGVAVFPLAYLILGSEYAVRTDEIGPLIAIMVLASLAGSSLGLTLGTAVKPDQIGALNALVIIPLIFTGCTYFSWSALSSIRWFQIVTLLNPLTYSTEGLRSTMMPPVHGLATSSLGLQWVLLGLFATIIVFLALGVRGFSKRAIR